MGFLRSGRFLDGVTNDRLRHSLALALSTPAVLLSQRPLGPHGKTEAELMQDAARADINAAAVALGLPPAQTDKHGATLVDYGVDFATGEVLIWDGVE